MLTLFKYITKKIVINNLTKKKFNIVYEISLNFKYVMKNPEKSKLGVSSTSKLQPNKNISYAVPRSNDKGVYRSTLVRLCWA